MPQNSIFVQIGDEKLYDGKTVAELRPLSTSELAAMTVAEICAFENTHILADPIPTIEHRIEERSDSDTLTVQYTGAYKLIVKATQAAEITRQKVVQGFGSGHMGGRHRCCGGRPSVHHRCAAQ